MSNLTSKELSVLKIQKGVKLLQEKQAYRQVDILRKLANLNKKISTPSFSNIISKGIAGLKTIKKCEEGIDMLIRDELDYGFDETEQAYVFLNTENWTSTSVPELSEKKIKGGGSLVYHQEGRLSIEEKANFISTANKEVIEFGVRLRNFADYFVSRKDAEFKDYVTALLKKGVHFKAYLLDPDCNEAHLYFNDRAKIKGFESEKKSIEVIRDAIIQLKHIIAEYEAEEYPGKFQVFLYKHIPYNHFLTVDGKHGKMLVSHYMYGVRRAQCPMISFSSQHNPDLYKEYWKSLQALTKNAKPLSS